MVLCSAIRGRVGDRVYKTYGDKLVVTRVPRFDGYVPSVAQRQRREKMRAATVYAQAVYADPAAKAVYVAAAKQLGRQPFRLAVSDFLQGHARVALDATTKPRAKRTDDMGRTARARGAERSKFRTYIRLFSPRLCVSARDLNMDRLNLAPFQADPSSRSSERRSRRRSRIAVSHPSENRALEWQPAGEVERSDLERRRKLVLHPGFDQTHPCSRDSPPPC